jgi:5-(carboxyamino)imidazole ribonucleotide mutase
MPAGIPVATVGAGGGGPVNAALCAARILALADAQLAARLVQFKEDMAAAVLAKDERLQTRLG